MNDMGTGREFDLGDVLSITTGTMVSLRNVKGIRDIMDYMTGQDLFRHQLSRAMRACAPHLLRQHPQLADIVVPPLDADSGPTWLAVQKYLYGETLTVRPIPADDYMPKDAMTELVEMVGEDRVIAVDVGGGGDGD